MTTPELIICRGLPASGKTTWAHAWVAEDRGHRARLNRDSLRLMVDDGVHIKGATEHRIITIEHAAARGLLAGGVSVVVDDTNLPERTVDDWINLATRSGATWRIQDFTTVDVDECIRRDAARTGREHIGEQVIRGMHDRFLALQHDRLGGAR